MTTSAKPILDQKVQEVLRSLDLTELFSSNLTSPIPDQRELFLAEFSSWSGLKLKELSLELRSWQALVTDGTTAAFSDFKCQFNERPLYVLRGEYPFHAQLGAEVKNSYLEVPSGSRLILSHPFSATGDEHEDLLPLLQYCTENNIKVLIDLALLFISDVKVPNFLHYNCVEALAFSLSKSFCTGRFKIGVCYTKEDWKRSPSFVLNQWSYLNHLSMAIHRKLMDNFSANYLLKKYRAHQQKLCAILNLKVSDTLIFGTTQDEEYKDFSRSGLINRVCLSEILGQHDA